MLAETTPVATLYLDGLPRLAVRGSTLGLIELAAECELVEFTLTNREGSFLIDVLRAHVCAYGELDFGRDVRKDLVLAAAVGAIVLCIAAVSNWVAIPPNYSFEAFLNDGLGQMLVATCLLAAAVSALLAFRLLRRTRPGLATDTPRLAIGITVTVAAALAVAAFLAAFHVWEPQSSGH